MDDRGADAPAPRRRHPVGRVLTVVAVLAMTAFWIWALSGAPARDNPDKLADRQWVERAGRRCSQARDRIDALPPARSADHPDERARTVVEANAELADLVSDLRADRVGGTGEPGDDDRRVVALWLDDWDRFLAARDTYADALERYDPATEEAPRFLVPENQQGDGIDAAIKAFADVNQIAACATPGDVG